MSRKTDVALGSGEIIKSRSEFDSTLSAKKETVPSFHPIRNLLSSNGFENLRNKASHLRGNQDGYHSQAPTRNHPRDLGLPRGHKSRLQPPTPSIMRSRIQVMGPIVPAPPLPHNPLHFQGYNQMARGIPGAGGEPCPPRQGATLLGCRV